MSRSQRRNLARTAADLAAAIRSGDASGVERSQRELACVERERRAVDERKVDPRCREDS